MNKHSNFDSSAPHLSPASGWDDEFDDWGVIDTMLEGTSRTYGKVLSRRPDGSSETGIWHCTPGTWQCHVISDEFCHFLSGRCVYTHESGDVINVVPDTIAYFPKDWKGICEVTETIRKVYMIR